MKNNTETIFLHDEEHIISYKRNAKELNIWIEHLDYIDNEIDYLQKLSEQKNPNPEKAYLINKLEKKRAENESILKEIIKYSENHYLINECDDIECDYLFIHKHESYRERYDHFVKSYRTIKNEVFHLML